MNKDENIAEIKINIIISLTQLSMKECQFLDRYVYLIARRVMKMYCMLVNNKGSNKYFEYKVDRKLKSLIRSGHIIVYAKFKDNSIGVHKGAIISYRKRLSDLE